MSLLDNETAYQTRQMFDESNKLVTLRHLVTVSGPNPTINPFNGTVTVGAGGVTQGSTSATLTAPVGNYFLAVGDAVVFAGSTSASVVQAAVTAAGGVFAAVQLSPGVSSASSAGAAVSITFTNDYVVEAAVAAYPTSLVDGTVITMKDLQVYTKLSDILGRTLPTPQPTDKVIMDNVTRSVGMVRPHYAGANQAMWEMQAKS